MNAFVFLCSLAGNDPHTLDPAAVSDVTPPSAVTVTNLDVNRHEDDNNACGNIASCGSYGSVTFDVAATDDAAPADKMGYRFRVANGTPPRGLDVERGGDIRTYGDQVYLYFDYDAPGFEFDLEVRAIDLNGNLGPPETVHIANRPADAGGCAAGKSRVPGLLFAAAALGLVLRKRRAR